MEFMTKRAGMLAVAFAVALGAAYFGAGPVEDNPPASRQLERRSPDTPAARSAVYPDKRGSWGRAAAPAHSQLPRNFDAAPDLHHFYVVARQSDDPVVVYQAYRAYVGCQALISNASNLRVAFAGGGRAEIEGEMTSERAVAADELLKRCHGFERMSERELAEAGADLRNKLKGLGSLEAGLDGDETSREVDTATMLALVNMRTASAFARAEPAVVSALTKSMGAAPGSVQARDIETAVMLAGCEIATDCSASAFGALLNCAYYDSCARPMVYDWREGRSEADITRIQELRSRIVQRLVSGDFK